MLTREQLQARIAELERRREELVMAANRELANLTGRIEELKLLLSDTMPDAAETETQ